MRLQNHYILHDNAVTQRPLRSFEKNDHIEWGVVNVYDIPRQTVLGFGGAFTDSAAYNYAFLSAANKKKVLEALFGETGLHYTICRIPMASCDFSPSMYTNIDEGDTALDTFSLKHDLAYKIPFIKDAMAFSGNKLRFFLSPWSPPAFMKENADRLHGGRLKPEYRDLWAEYFCRFIEAYAEQGIRIEALTPQNEPMASQTWESCYFDLEDTVAFVRALDQALTRHGLDTAILTWDHNKERLVEVARATADLPRVKGFGYHWYSGTHYDAVEITRDLFPDRLIIETEFCQTVTEHYSGRYSDEVIKSLDSGANALVEWNLILDETGGPYHDRTGGCNAPLIVNAATGKPEKSAVWRQMSMISRFCQTGAVVLRTSVCADGLLSCAFRNPDGCVVCVIANHSETVRTVNLRVFSDHVYTTPVKLDEVHTFVLKEDETP